MNARAVHARVRSSKKAVLLSDLTWEGEKRDRVPGGENPSRLRL